VEDRTIVDTAGAVDEDVQRAGSAEDFPDRRGVGDVEFCNRDARRDICQVFHLGDAAAGCHNAPSLLSESNGDRPADPLSGPGHESILARETTTHASSP